MTPSGGNLVEFDKKFLQIIVDNTNGNFRCSFHEIHKLAGV